MVEREQRISTDLPVGVKRPDESDGRPARVLNISDGGLLVEGDEVQRAPGDSLAVEIPPAGDRGRVLVLAEVAWTDNGRKGLKVQGMMPHHRMRFEALLEQLAVAA
jgi:hypothetical protein